eukprot:gene17814-biopygen2580
MLVKCLPNVPGKGTSRQLPSSVLSDLLPSPAAQGELWDPRMGQPYEGQSSPSLLDKSGKPQVRSASCQRDAGQMTAECLPDASRRTPSARRRRCAPPRAEPAAVRDDLVRVLLRRRGAGRRRGVGERAAKRGARRRGRRRGGRTLTLRSASTRDPGQNGPRMTQGVAM